MLFRLVLKFTPDDETGWVVRLKCRFYRLKCEFYSLKLKFTNWSLDLHIITSITEQWFKIDFVPDLNYKYKEKTHSSQFRLTRIHTFDMVTHLARLFKSSAIPFN